MAEYASNTKANTAVTLASVLGGIGTLNALGGCNGNGLLGNLFGGNCNNARMGAELQYVSSLQAENAMLKSENYTDKSALEAYKQSVADNKELRDEMYAFIKPLADEAAQNRVNIATLQAELKCCCEKQELREQILMGKVNEVALMAGNGITALQGAVNCLQATVASITEQVVPITKVCPQPMPQFNSWTAPTATAPTSVTLTNPVVTTVGK